MASVLYPEWKNKLLTGSTTSTLNGAEGATGVYVALVDAGTYTYSAAHTSYADLGASVVDEGEILNKTNVAGTFDGDDVVIPTVTGLSIETLVLFRKNAGANSTWDLIAHIEAADVTNLPLTPNNGEVEVVWDVAGILTL